MFLRRVTITGFKSFANKTVLDLEPGITGVVGPNGSGKSNIADAIRWALGEQGKNRLRLGGSTEVVFAGTSKRARASFAEVVLLFDNEDGAFPLDLTEVEISRRLYRSGETDYRLAGRSVRLSDIQALLAGAGVGASTYAVIGQGMIDSILMSSPAERKLLFEEAAGIRGPELGREAALRKLTATAANLTRLRDIAAELEPRAGTLEVTVRGADERSRLQARVAELQAAVSAAEQAHWRERLAEAADSLERLTHTAHTLRHRRHTFEHAWARHERAQAAAATRRAGLQQGLAELELHRDRAAANLAAAVAAAAEATRAAAAKAELTKRVEAAHTNLEAAAARLSELRSDLASNAEAAARAATAVEKSAREVATAQQALVAVRDGTGDGARDQYVGHAMNILKLLALGIGTPQYTEDQIRILVHKAGRLLSHASRRGAAELVADLKTAQKQLEAAMAKRETAVEHQTNVSITRRSLEIDLAYQEAEITRLTERHQQSEAELAPIEAATKHAAELAAALSEAEQVFATTTARLDLERSELAVLATSTHDMAAASRLLNNLEQAKQALVELAASQQALRREYHEATVQLAVAHQKALAWGLTGTPAPSDQPLSVLVDQLARAETLWEARSQAYEEQLGEYHKITERQAELVAQIADLEVAELDLRQLVAELDKLIRARFKENFQALAEQFSLYFSRLFDGGQASLELTDDADTGYGITIKASANGKRLSSIAALSGGERALAGVALVAAIMRVNPSPFVVLDEIDAALDEANSGRLSGILSEIQQYSQLIVITHNRQTMKAAQVLFGVTINEHHISHLISMRLEQATELAAR